MWGLFDDESVFTPIIEDFQRDNPTIKITYVKKDYADYEEKSVDAIASGEGPDIWLIRNDWVWKHYKKLIPMPDGQLAKNDSSNQTRSNEEIYKDTFAPIAATDNIIDGKIYGLPLSIDTLSLIYNKDIFKEERQKLLDEKKISQSDKTLSDPPSNWEEVISNVKLLTQKSGDNITRPGISLGTSNNIDRATDILYALMLQNNTNMVATDKKSATFNLPITKQTGEPVYPGTQALDFYTSFSNPQKETYSWNSSQGNAYDMFKQGKLAMMIDYDFQVNRLKQEVPNLNFDFAPLPQIKNVESPTDYASYWTESVTKNSKHPESAWQFIAYMGSRGLTNYLRASKRPSPLKPNASSIPKVSERVDHKSATFTFQVESAKDWFKGRYPIKVDQVFTELINNVSSRLVGSQAAIDTAANKVTILLQGE